MTIAAYRTSAKEREIEQTIIEGVQRSGGYAFHVRDSRRQNVKGMPDLILILPRRGDRPGIVALIEVKSQRREVEDHQRHVLDMLEQCSDVVSGIVRPKPKPGEMDLDTALALIGVETQEATR